MVCWGLPILRIIIVVSSIWRTQQQVQIISSVLGVILVAVFQPHTNPSHNYINSILFGGLVVIFVLMLATHSRHSTHIVIYCIPLIVMVIQLCWRCKAKMCSVTTIHQCLKLVIVAKHSDLDENATTAQCLDERWPLLEKAQY